MNARILELIKNPEIINFNDLNILESEINNYPYIQNIRALHLLGISRHAPENYLAELSKTAAYTTDKKILYQFITGKKISENKEVSSEEKEVPNPKFKLKSIIKPSIEVVDSDAELALKANDNQDFNEISKVENFSKEIVLEDSVTSETEIDNELSFQNIEHLDTENQIVQTQKHEKVDETIHLKSDEIIHQETETLTTENQVISNEISDNADDSEDFSKEEIINEDAVTHQELEIEHSPDISFHGAEDFMPEVKLNTNNSDSKVHEAPRQNLSRHNDEIQKLIAEVEAKMKQVAKPRIIEEDSNVNNDIDFAGTQDASYEIEKTEMVREEQNIELQNLNAEPPKSEWKPMSFSPNPPDSVLNINPEKSSDFVENQPEILENSTIIHQNLESESLEKEEISEEIPEINVSFFSQNISPINQETDTNSQENLVDKQNEEEISESKSNVSHFINTWQNWLKLDRKEETQKESLSAENKKVTEEKPKEDFKAKVIETFIEKEPKISKLKEESTEYVIKEKSSNISHLMTETLAKLYLEQKHYTKAINAYEILKEKYPEKSEEFNKKIQEIKEIYSKK